MIPSEWKLPAKLTSLIRDHHTQPADDDPLRTERLQLQLTDLIVVLLGYGVSLSFDLLGTEAASGLGLAEHEDFLGFLPGLPQEVSEGLSWF